MRRREDRHGGGRQAPNPVCFAPGGGFSIAAGTDDIPLYNADGTRKDQPWLDAARRALANRVEQLHGRADRLSALVDRRFAQQRAVVANGLEQMGTALCQLAATEIMPSAVGAAVQAYAASLESVLRANGGGPMRAAVLGKYAPRPKILRSKQRGWSMATVLDKYPGRFRRSGHRTNYDVSLVEPALIALAKPVPGLGRGRADAANDAATARAKAATAEEQRAAAEAARAKTAAEDARLLRDEQERQRIAAEDRQRREAERKRLRQEAEAAHAKAEEDARRLMRAEKEKAEAQRQRIAAEQQAAREQEDRERCEEAERERQALEAARVKAKEDARRLAAKLKAAAEEERERQRKASVWSEREIWALKESVHQSKDFWTGEKADEAARATVDEVRWNFVSDCVYEETCNVNGSRRRSPEECKEKYAATRSAPSPTSVKDLKPGNAKAATASSADDENNTANIRIVFNHSTHGADVVKFCSDLKNHLQKTAGARSWTVKAITPAQLTTTKVCQSRALTVKVHRSPTKSGFKLVARNGTDLQFIFVTIKDFVFDFALKKELQSTINDVLSGANKRSAKRDVKQVVHAVAAAEEEDACEIQAGTKAASPDAERAVLKSLTLARYAYESSAAVNLGTNFRMQNKGRAREAQQQKLLQQKAKDERVKAKAKEIKEERRIKKVEKRLKANKDFTKSLKSSGGKDSANKKGFKAAVRAQAEINAAKKSRTY